MKKKMNIEEIKSQAEKFAKLDELTLGTLPKRIAEAMIKEHGFYAATVDGVKTFITK